MVFKVPNNYDTDLYTRSLHSLPWSFTLLRWTNVQSYFKVPSIDDGLTQKWPPWTTRTVNQWRWQVSTTAKITISRSWEWPVGQEIHWHHYCKLSIEWTYCSEHFPHFTIHEMSMNFIFIDLQHWTFSMPSTVSITVSPSYTQSSIQSSSSSCF